MFSSDEEENYYRHALMACMTLGDPTRIWFLAAPGEVLCEYRKMCEKVPSVKKKDLDYYEKKLMEFKEVKI